MTRYTITPYKVSVYANGSPKDLRDIAEVVPGVSMARLFADAFAAHGNGPFCAADFEVTGRSIDFEAVSLAGHTTAAVAMAGQTGVEGALRKPGQRIDITREDLTELRLRHLLYGTPGHKFSVLFAERASGRGAMTMVNTVLQKVFKTRCDQQGLHLSLLLEPLVDATAVRNAYAQLPIKQIELTPIDPKSGRPSGDGQRLGSMHITLKSPRKFPWTAASVGGMDAEGILASVGALAKSADVAGIEPLLASAERWDVAVTVARGHLSKTVHVEAGSTPSMSFEVGDAGAGRPSDEEFVAACREALNVFGMASEGLTMPTHLWQADSTVEAVLKLVVDSL